MHAISSKHNSNEFPNGLNLDNKIEIYFDRVLGWQLTPAQDTADNVKHSGFAVLHIVLSFFESIAKYRDGFCQKGHSNEYFKKGFELVFPEIRQKIANTTQRQEFLDNFYDNVRCGIYHVSLTGSNVMITGDLNAVLHIQEHSITINPHQIVNPLEIYLRNYVRDLRDTKNIELRAKFEARFDFDSGISSTTI